VTAPGHEVEARRAYDAVAEPYTAWAGPDISAATEAAVDRALLGALVDLLVGGPAGPVADLGCGPGRVAALMAGHGLTALGLDLSPGMVAQAGEAHPGLPVLAGSLRALPFADGALAGAVCWYSIIHTPPEGLAAVAAELARVLRPDAHLLVAFQAGDGGRRHRAEAFGRPISLDSFRHEPDLVAEVLAGAGLLVHTRVVRDPGLDHESSPQAFLLARRGSW